MLNQDEKKYLWSRIENRRKKLATENKNDLYKLLNEDGNVSEEDFTKILNSLEYSFKKQLKEGTLKSEIFLSIYNKLPKDWLGVKFSVLKNKEDRKPSNNSSKKEITDYLKSKNIDYDEKMKKSELLNLFENKNILTWNGFNKI